MAPPADEGSSKADPKPHAEPLRTGEPPAEPATHHHTRALGLDGSAFGEGEAGGSFLLTVRPPINNALPDDASHRISLRLDLTEPGRCLVGSSAACTLRLTDPTVSRRHAALEVQQGCLVVTDLGSRNGTWVSGVRIREAMIDDQATIEVGAVTIQVERDRGAPFPPLPNQQAFGRMVGASVSMRRLYPLCAKLAVSTIPLVIEGETGTGKEALAESLHEEGPRREGPFVVFDCTTVTSNLLEAELFGHEKGAFTGAERAREGVFAQAHGGTLFIDEIGDMDLPLQAKLLRAIDRGDVRPIGAARSLKVDVRIIAATRRDLDREVQTGRFRDDLFHRLAIGRIELPPLRQRKGDVARLARHFWQALGGDPRALPMALLARWEADPWPGNVRELRNAVARYLALGELAALTPRAASPTNSADADGFAGLEALPLSEARALVVERFERQYIEKVLERMGGNVTKAAAHAGVARRYFHILKARLEPNESD